MTSPTAPDMGSSKLLELSQTFLEMNRRLRKVADSDFTVLPGVRNPAAASNAAG